MDIGATTEKDRALPVHEIDWVLERLEWMRERRIWPNGPRYLWTDAFGVVLLLSLHRETGEERWLAEAERVVAEVERVLGRERGIRIGEAADRDGQYFHYLAMWLFALHRLGEEDPRYRERAVELVEEIHPAFVIPGRGVLWKMREDLSGPYSGYGFGALDPFHGLVVYRLLDSHALAHEIGEMEELVGETFKSLHLDQDLGLGMMLWMTHFFPAERWAVLQRVRSLNQLERMWIDPPGYVCRHPRMRDTRFAFTNYGVSIGLQSVGEWPARVRTIHDLFVTYRSGDEYDEAAITWVMACCARLPGLLLRTDRGASPSRA
ncbi:MAG: hypothetical protein KY397_03045 [Gemmatimonadetes bacterium]|nr:hypothetical protein [Gemmatimonadota bacterium]